MFSSCLSPGVTIESIRNTLGSGAKTGSASMRLRLFERLGRLVSWRFGSQRAGNGGPRNPRTAGPEGGGRHRRNPGRAQPQNRVAAGPRASHAAAPPLQPPPGLPRRAPQSPPGGTSPRAASPAPRAAAGRATGPAAPPLPRNYTPGGGGGAHRAGADQGGAIRRRPARHRRPRAWRHRPGRRRRGAGTGPGARPGGRGAAAALVPGDRRPARGPAPYRAGRPGRGPRPGATREGSSAAGKERAREGA